MDRRRRVRSDLHNHFRTSSRVRSGDIKKITRVSKKRLGPGGVVGLVNFDDFRYERSIDRSELEGEALGPNSNGFYFPEEDITIVKGQEVPTRDGHLLVFGLGWDNYVKKGSSLSDTMAEAKEKGGVIVADHPFYACGTGRLLGDQPHLLEDFDAIEVYNGEASFAVPWTQFRLGANKKAMEFYRDKGRTFRNMGRISSSDGHSFYEVGRCWTEIEEPTKGEGFVESLRKSIRATGGENATMQAGGLISTVGMVDHLADLATIISMEALGSERFNTRRPPE